MVTTPRAPGACSPLRPAGTSSARTGSPVINVGHSSLLAAPEERVLGQQWAAGRQAQARLRALQEAGQSIPSATGAHLLAQVQVARQARRRLILACAPLVEGLAGQYSGYGVPREDLVQDGWLGVVQAAAGSNPAKGPSFSRHAAWSARKAILAALTSRSRLIRLPAGVVEAIRRISAARQQWEQTELDPPSVADLAQRTGLPPERVRQVLGVMDPPFSLDAAGESRLGTTVPDAPSAPLESQGLAAVQRQEVWTALGRLDPRARQVVVWRFGMLDGAPNTLDEVATLVRLPVAEVRTLEAAALATLRALLAAPVAPSA